MSRVIRNLTLALGAAVSVVPSLLAAQPAQGPRGAMQPPMERPAGRVQRPGAITHLLNARRQLDLTPRQIAQLDSLERIQFAEHRAFAEQMRPARDSMQARARSGAGNPASRDSLRVQARTRMEAQRPQHEQRRERDSSLSIAAERVLNDAQRQKVRELQAERRGYERGMRESRGQRGGPQARRSQGPSAYVLRGARRGHSFHPPAGLSPSRSTHVDRPDPRIHARSGHDHR